ncbi:MAG: DMT family transporter [Pseudomonadota bacterium]
MATGTVRLVSSSFGPIALVLIAMVGFSIQDIAVKVVSDDVSLWQLMFVRSTATLGLMVVIAAVLRQGGSLVPHRWGWPMVRAVFMAGAYLFFYAAIAYMPVTTAAATFFTGPLMITLMAALILGEPIGPRRIIAVIVGFAGVLVIIRPGFGTFELVALLPVISAFCYAAGNVITRWRCRDEPNFALSMVHNLLYANIGMVGVLLIPTLGFSAEAVAEQPFVLSAWLEPSGLSIALMLMTAGTHLVGILFIVRAYQNEDASKLAPFEYSYLVFIPVLEFAIWQTFPDQFTLIGMSLIMSAGIFVAWREGRPARPRIHTQGEHPWTPDAEDER